MARGCLPLLVHALLYKGDPPSFIKKQEQLVGPVFRINLAGQHMVVVGSSPEIMKQVASLPSSIMSSEKAIGDVGFEYSLGKTNIFQGTAWHKRILKDEVFDSLNFKPSFLPNLRPELSKAVRK